MRVNGTKRELDYGGWLKRLYIAARHCQYPASSAIENASNG